MRYGKEILLFALGCAFTSICFLLFQNRELEKQIIEVEKPVVKTETKIITKTDTIYKVITKPKYITQTIIRTDTIKANSTIPPHLFASTNAERLLYNLYSGMSIISFIVQRYKETP